MTIRSQITPKDAPPYKERLVFDHREPWTLWTPEAAASAIGQVVPLRGVNGEVLAQGTIVDAEVVGKDEALRLTFEFELDAPPLSKMLS